MTNVDVVRHFDGLKSALDRARSLSDDPELLGHWGRYVCVLSAGYFENAVRILYSSHAQDRATPAVTSFVVKQLDRVQNPKASRLVEVTRAFDAQWADNLVAFLEQDDGRRKNAIDSIMNNRHLIAHGRNANISVAQVREYLKSIGEVVDFLEAQCS